MQLDDVIGRLDFSRLKPTEKSRYINRIRNIVAVVQERFPYIAVHDQIHLKHVQYFRNVWLPAHTSSERTRAEHMRALGLLVVALDRPHTWLGALGIRQPSEKGGRPSRVGVRRSKKYH